MQQLSGSLGRASAQPCCSRAAAGPARREPNITRVSRGGVFVEVFRGPGGLAEVVEGDGELVLRGPGGLGAFEGEALLGRGEDRRRE